MNGQLRASSESAVAEPLPRGAMRITEIEAISLCVPIEGEIRAPIAIPHADKLADVIFRAYRATIVRIKTDCGLEGVGECIVRLAPTATRAIIEELAPLLVGRDPLDREVLWELSYGVMMNRGHSRGFFIEALSGLDMALWDLAGKAVDQPLYKLLGGLSQDRLKAYASSLRTFDFDDALRRAEGFVAHGFDAIKIKMGRGRPAEDIAFLRGLREKLPASVKLMVDVNCAFADDVAGALQMGRQLQELDIYWFEEPIAPHDIEGYCHLADRLDLRIAAGEGDFMSFGAAEFLRRHAVDVIQPNLSRVGGITEGRRIAAMSRAFHIPYAPHTGASSAVCLAASAQFAAALPNFVMFESMQADWSASQPNPLRTELLTHPVEVLSEGHLLVGDRPGIGVELNMDVVERYRIQ